MKRRAIFIAGLISLLAILTTYTIAFAHEAITVGDYTVEIGWLSEPPVVGQENAIFVQVTTTADKQPVEEVSGLTVTMSYGGQEKALTLQPLGEDTPGQFVAPILPTVPGQYTVRLGGTLGNTPANADMQPEEVQSADTLQFPAVSTGQEPNLGTLNWLIYLSLLVGLTGLILGVMALRKSR